MFQKHIKAEKSTKRIDEIKKFTSHDSRRKIKNYEKVQMLHTNKLSINKISRVLKITPKTVKHLIKNRPSLRYGFFKPKPCRELSYIIGVCFGDASLYKQKNYHYKIELRAKDKEFVEKFSYCLALFLTKNLTRFTKTESILESK